MKRIFVVCVAAIITAGCASAPERKPPQVEIETPADWTVTEPPEIAMADTARWWVYFENAVIDTLVDEALLNNFDLKSAVARVDAAAAVAKAAGADLFPQAALRFDAARRKQNLIGFPIPGSGSGVISTRSTSLGVSLDIAWELDLWGRIRAGQSAALADMQATWAELAGARLSISAQVVKSWFAVTEARMQLELAEQTVESWRLSADQVRRRYEEGVRTSLDLRLALSNLYAAEALLQFRKQQLDQTKRQLEILLGRYPSASLVAEADLPSVSGEVPTGLPSELLIRRPDLLAAERRYAAAEKRVSQARRAFFPRLSLTGSGGTLSKQLEDLVDGDFSVWSIAANLTQPIFQGGRLKANLENSHAIADQILAQYAVSLLTAFGEVEALLFAEQTLAEQERHTADAAEQSEAARLLAERQYNAGLIDYITVLETQRRALNSQSELITVRRQRLDARVNLHVSLGGGFDLNDEWTTFLAMQSPEIADADTNSETEAPGE